MALYQALLIILSCIIIALIILLVIYRSRLNSTFKKIKTLIENLIIDTYDDKDETSKIIQKNAGIHNKQMLENYVARLKKNIDTLLKNSRQKTNLVNLILNNVSLGILIIDNNRRIIQINESLLSLFYLDKIKIIDNKTIMVFNNENFENLISKSFNNLETHQERITFFGDEDIYLDIVAIPIAPEYSIITKEDIRKLRDMQTKINLFIIIKNITQEIEFSKLRSQFVANISHEMKTPLTSIKGYTETAIEDDMKDKDKIKSYLEKSLNEVNRLNFLIDDVLNLSKIEYKRITLHESKCNLASIINDCIKSLNFLANQNNIKIKFNYGDNQIKYRTDEELFNQIIKNLLENSIFYSGEGSTLEINLKRSNDNILLDFVDNGIGIDKKDLPYIFQRFYRGTNPSISKRIGSGLGLSIVKHIVDMHNGKIMVASKPNIETKFSIILPIQINI